MSRFNTPAAPRRVQGSLGAWRDAHQHQPRRDQARATLSPEQALERLRPGHADPMRVLDLLITLYNAQHTAREKTVSHKTRQERADFLRRFFRDLHRKAGFKMVPDPRNLGDRHIRAMVAVWQKEKLAPATIQTYLSFLRGLALWLGKPGFIRKPDHYGLSPDEYQRHENAQRDKSWTAAGIDIDAVIEQVCLFDRYIGASLKLMRAFGLRRKESVMFRPHRCVVPFEATGLPPEEQRQAEWYVRIQEGAKGGRLRFVPLDSPERIAAVEFAQSIAEGKDAHMGNPRRSLARNLRRFDYVMARFHITKEGLGATSHGLRHEAAIDHYTEESGGIAPTIRGGGSVSPEVDLAARQSVARLAGHNRIRASGAYLGPMQAKAAALRAQRNFGGGPSEEAPRDGTDQD